MILAIDPGTTHSALVTYDPMNRAMCAYEDNETLLLRLQRWPHRVDALAIEMPYMGGMPAGREVFHTCRWVGRFEQAMAENTRIVLIERHEVKLHLCRNTRAKDGNVRQALIDKLGPVGTKKNPGPCYGMAGDLWSALAVAVTFAETRQGGVGP